LILLELGLYFAVLSLLSFGGMSSVLPEMQRYMVDVKGWMSATEFMQLFAVAQAAPGPNVLMSSLVGWKVAGFAGSLVALARCADRPRACLVGVGPVGAVARFAVAQDDPERARATGGRPWSSPRGYVIATPGSPGLAPVADRRRERRGNAGDAREPAVADGRRRACRRLVSLR